MNILRFIHRVHSRDLFNTAVHVAGVSFGVVCVSLLVSFISFHRSFDQYPGQDLYRLTLKNTDREGREKYRPTVDERVGESVVRSLVGQAETVRVSTQDVFISVDGLPSRERAAFVDGGFFSLFPVHGSGGLPGFGAPDAAVLTESESLALFGGDARGKTFFVSGAQFPDRRLLRVVAVIPDPPLSTRFNYGVYLPYSLYETSVSLAKERNAFYYDTELYFRPVGTGVELTPGAASRGVDAGGISPVPLDGEYRAQRYIAERVRDLHLFSKVTAIDPDSPLFLVVFLSAMTGLIVLVAFMNVVSIGLAKAQRRMKEYGIRKVCGAKSRNIVAQGMLEALYPGSLAACVSVIALYLIVPGFEEMVGMDYLEGIPPAFTVTLAVALSVGFSVLAGFYPALRLSRLDPVEAIKGRYSARGRRLRSALVAAQLGISSLVLILSGFIGGEISRIRSADPGFSPDGILYAELPISDRDRVAAFERAVAAALSIDVGDVSASSWLPWVGGEKWRPTFSRGSDGREGREALMFDVDWRYFSVLSIPLRSATSAWEQSETLTGNLVVNRSAAQAFNWSLGDRVSYNDTAATVVGITEDYNFEFPAVAVEPLVHRLCASGNPDARMFFFRNPAGRTGEATARVRAIWPYYFPDAPFEMMSLPDELYRTLDEDIGSVMTKVFRITVLVAYIVAMLGVYGLSRFMTHERSREIAIRRVAGARPRAILALLAGKFLSMGVAANAAAWVLALGIFTLAFNVALDYPLRVSQPFLVLIRSTLLCLAVISVTVARELVAASNEDPIVALRRE